MENKSNLIEYFQAMLQRKCVNKPSVLYQGNNKKEKLTERTQDVINSVNVQIKAMQLADCVKSGRLSNMNYEQSNFLTVNNLPHNIEELQQDTNNKFETQCVSDTQLMEIVKTAEVLSGDKVMTQEFNNTFSYKTYDKDRCVNKHRSDDFKIVSHTEFDNIKTVKRFSSEAKKSSQSMFENLEDQRFSPDIFVENIDKCMELEFEAKSTNFIDKNSSIIFEADEKINNNMLKDFNTVDSCNEDKEINDSKMVSLSPVSNVRSVKQSNSPSPLIFDLKDFERFETVAFPDMIKCTDLNTIKHSINSQILDMELQLFSKTKEEVQQHSPSINTESELPIKSTLTFNIPIETENIKPNNSIQDDILFSSDEDENYIHKKSQDLPFTSAPETYFYNQSDILDRTMYVGFQTASNKSIQVFSESFSKAKSILDDLDDNYGKKELVEKCDDVSVSKCDNSLNILENIEGDYVRENMKKIMNKYKNDEAAISTQNGSVSDKLPKLVPFDTVENSNLYISPDNKANRYRYNMGGFVTASNKSIKLSEIALTRSKKVFQGIDLVDDFDTNVEENDNVDNVISDGRDINIEVTKINDEVTNIKDETYKVKKLQNIDDEHILQEFQNSEMTRDNLKNKVDSSLINNNCKCIKESKQEFVNHHFESCYTPTTNSEDFKIYRNKLIKSSIEPIIMEKAILKNLQFTDNDKLETFHKNGVNKELVIVFDHSATNTSPLNSFETDNNKQMLISNETLIKTKNSFQDIDKPIEEHNKNMNKKYLQLQGFKTANNKKIKISYEALHKSKKVFEDIALGLTDNSTINSKSEKNEQDFFLKHNKIHENSLNDEYLPNIVGFKTASNKSVTISKQALEKSAKLLQDLDQNEMLDRSISKKDVSDSVNIQIPCFTGFQTASNKTVKISAQALAKTKKIFQDLNLSNSSESDATILPLNENIPAQTHFQTASNKKVIISAEALAKSKKKIENEVNAEIDTYKHNLEKLTEFDCTYKHNCPNSHHDFASSFKGFQTANNKEVKISEKALAKCRQIFQDEDLSSQLENNIQVLDKNRISTILNNDHLIENENLKIETSDINNLGFKTASNRKILISDDALVKSKKILDELHNKTVKASLKDKHLGIDKFEDKEILQNIVNTQILNNFDETLYTEDFDKEAATSKRSSSPILSCPKAKKRKFETPYKLHQIPIEISEVDNVEDKKKLIFQEDYKKCKLYQLKDIQNFESKHSIKNMNTYNITFDNLLHFKFSGKRNELTNTELKIEQVKEMFISAVNQKLIPEGWLDNHLKLILWKLLSYEIVYPNTLGIVCTVNNVLNQLKYRYDKELYNAERPALRKILEKDDVPSKTLILCVVDILRRELDENSVTSLENTVEILVTDGWYCVKACLDKMLTELVNKKKILGGTKIVTNGAELLNCEQGVSPWEDTSSIRLKLFGNSTRRARWDTRLGYHCNISIVSRLSLVRVDGGRVSKLRVLVTRVYPALYIEKFEDGNTVTRSERLEHLHEMKYESERQALLERLYEEVEKEFSDVESQDSEDLMNLRKKRKTLDSSSQMMKRSSDAFEFENQLTESQTTLLQDRASRHRERLLRAVQARLLEKMDKHGLCQKRNVVTLLKVRVAEVEEKGDGVQVTKGMLSVWKPNESVSELIREGVWINVMNVVPTSFRCSELHISAGRQSIFSKSKYKENDKMKPHIQPLLRTCCHIKELIRRASSTKGYNEIDTVGIIVSIEPSIQSFELNKNQFQNVFLADENKNMICVNFWGGLKKFGFEKVLDTGEIVACVNLQERVGNTRKNIPQYRATEFTCFTKAPKNITARGIIEDLDKKLHLDRRKFCEDCVNLKNNVTRLQSNENITPYRVNNVNFPKNRMFIDTPTGVKANVIDEFDLSGLDFESTFKQKDTQEISPKVLMRKKQVQEKINRLKMYGEPPPLCPIHIINKSAIKSYKSPLRSDENSVATSKNIPENLRSTDSPVTSINTTYVKNAFNPVKINFDNVDNNISGVDHFPEDFDCSPPLSLE